jgi:site-specific recombinase XerD
MFKHSRTLIRRLDEILENKLFSPCFRESTFECPPHFAPMLEEYLTTLAKRGLKDSTIKARKSYVGKLLGRIPQTVKSLEKITAADLYTVFSDYSWPSTGLVAARDFLAALYRSGVTKVDLSVCVPNPRRPRSLPSVYSESEVTRLLSSIDRSTILGKRDYAILMLASHMGLRSSDIVNLSFSDINYAAKTIDIVQVKTSNPVTLVMNAEIELAITGYIQNGRPTSSSDKIFLGSQAPYAPLSAASGHAIAHRHFARAGITALGRRRGTQALRASYATALVAKGIPYVVVQEALGHDDPESAKYYARIDVRRLRSCALDIPKPSGAFAVMLGDLEGVL